MLVSLVLQLSAQILKDNLDEEAEEYLNFILIRLCQYILLSILFHYRFVVGMLKEEFQEVQFKD